MRRHGPASYEDDKAGDEVALRVAVTILAHPDASQTRTPPDDAHGRVLPVIFNPRGAPAVLREGVDAAPRRNDGAIVKLLRPPRAPHPDLADQQNNGENDTVAYEGAAHDEVRGALADVLALAEAQRRDAAKDQLRPRQDRHGLADDGVARPDELADEAIDSALPVALEVQPQNDLGDE